MLPLNYIHYIIHIYFISTDFVEQKGTQSKRKLQGEKTHLQYESNPQPSNRQFDKSHVYIVLYVYAFISVQRVATSNRDWVVEYCYCKQSCNKTCASFLIVHSYNKRQNTLYLLWPQAGRTYQSRKTRLII